MNNEKQKLEALLKEAAASQKFAPSDDALSQLIEKYKPAQIDTQAESSEALSAREPESFQDFLALVKHRQNRKSS